MSDPNQSPTPESSGPKSAKRETRECHRLLLVEGDGFTRLILLLRLRMAGFEVDFTSNGVLALTKLRSRHPDALVVDIKLRGLSGVELIKQARRDPAFGSRPIYVFTDVSQMNRSTRKEVRMVATKVFDKRAMSRENLVAAVAAELRKPEADGEERLAQPAAAKGAEDFSEMILPGEIEEIVHGVRAQTKLLTKSRDAAARVANGGELLSRVCSLASCAEAAGLRNLARQAKVLEAFLGQVCKQGKEFADSALRTVSRAVEVMGLMCAGTAGKQHNASQFTAVVIDEVPPSNEAISEALFNAGFNPASFEDPARAREYLASNSTHLIVANVLLPELHGLTLPKIRQLPGHATTPVVFVAEPSADGKAPETSPTTTPRLDSNPVQLMELVVKALNEVQSTPPPKQGAPASGSSAPGLSLEETDFYMAETSPVSSMSEPTGMPDPVEDTVVIPAPAAVPPAPIPEPVFQSIEAPANLQPADQPPVQPLDDAHEKKTVLFVEDDPFVVKAYKKCLKREGFEVEVAEDGVVALEMLPAVKPHVVILDLMLPKLHGLEVLKFIRGDDNLKDTPVLVLSNAYLEGLAVKANQAGANKGILKTHCSPDKLVDEVCGLLGRARRVPASPPIFKEPAVITPQDDAVSLEQTAIWTRQSGMRKDAPKEIAKIRKACLEYIKANGADESLEHLASLYRWVRFLGARAALSGFTKIAELSSALEGLLFQIVFKQTEPATSTFQTIAQAVDCLDRLIQNRDMTYPEPRSKPKVLVVDDDSVCNFSMTTALKRANFDSVGLQDPLDALRLLEAGGFDLILLDVNMPQLNGFELCEKLRQMPHYKSVPVIFVTINAEFQNRARSVIAGGNDLMGKPVSPMELILKATMHLLNSGAQKAPGQTESSKESDTTWALDAMHVDEPATNIADRSVSLPAISPEPAADLAIAASLASEPQPSRLTTELVAESEVDASSRLSETSLTNTQTDAPRIESLQAHVSESETSEAGIVEEQQAEAELPASGAAEAAEAPSEAPTQFEAVTQGNGSASAAESTPATQESYQTPTKPYEEDDTGLLKTRAPAPSYEKERETLVSRIYTAENELFRTQARLERKEKAIENLKKQLEELAAKTQLEHQKAEKSAEGVLSTQSGELPEAEATANEAAVKAQKEAQARAEQLEQELAGLRQAREELNARISKEQQVSAEASKRLEELEKSLGQGTADLAKAKDELQKQRQEQERVESELRARLDAAGAAQEKAQSRCGQLEQELAGLRQAKEELSSRVNQEQQLTAETGNRVKELEQHLGEKSAELERARAEAERQATERERLESDLRAQLKATASAQEQAQVRCRELEQELAGFRKSREELSGQISQEQHVAAESGKRAKELEQRLDQSSQELERARTELSNRKQEQERVEADLRAQLKSASAAHEQTQSRCSQLEQELAGLRQSREELDTKFTRELQVNVDSGKRFKDLEHRLAHGAAELERALAELKKQKAEHDRADSELRHQLEAASATSKKSETAYKDTQARYGQLEQELAALRHAREELNRQLVQQQRASAESGDRIKELENYLSKRSMELQRTRADFEKQAQDRSRVESNLRDQLESANVANKQTESAYKQAQTRCSQLEAELAGLRQTREELNGKFGKEQQVTAESRARIKELEDHLVSKSAELEKTKAELEKHAKDRNRVEAKLRQQLHKTSAAIQQSEDAQKQAQARYRQLEEELAGLRQVQTELTSKLGKEQQVTNQSREKIKELEAQLGSKSAELQHARAELEKQVKEHSQAEADLRQQLDKASITAKQNDEAQRQAQARCTQLEQELAGLRRAREELTTDLGKQRQAAEASRAQLKELEVQLGQRLAELDRARVELQNQTRERGHVESELRRQLEVSLSAIQQSEAAHKQTLARSLQVGHELADLQQAHKDLAGKLDQEQQITAESRGRVKELETQLGSKAAELERARAELDSQTKEHDRAQSDLRQQLAAAGATLQQREAAHQQAQARSGQLERDVTELRQARAELAFRFTQEQQVTAQSRSRIAELAGDLALKSAELQKQTNERERMESDLRRQLEATAASFKQTQTAHEQALSQAAQLQQELTGHREAKEELSRKLAREQQAAAESRAQLKDLERRFQLGEAERGAQITELEQRVRQGVAALSRVTADLASERGERRRSEQTVAALNVRLQELHEDFTRAIQAQRASHERLGALEEQLRRTEQVVVQRTADVEQQQTERRLAEDQLRKAKDQNAQFRKHLAFFEEANKKFDVTRQDLEAKLAASLSAAQEIGARLQREAAERQRVADSLDGVQRDLQNQTRKRETLEKELETTFQGLQEREARFQKEAAERQNLAATLEAVQRELQYQSRKREELEKELQSTLGALHESEARFLKESAERQSLVQARDGLQSQLENQSQKRQALEAELQTTFGALHESEVRFQKEMAERQRLSQALESAELSLRDRSKQSELDCSRLQTALQFEQVERKRQESQMVRMRHFTLEAARGARALRNTLRRQIREPVDNLCQSARSLLELELAEPQKKLAQSVLEDVLLLNARLQETEAAPGVPTNGSSNGDNAGGGTNGSEFAHALPADLTQKPV